jgi:2-polyprenyl-6-methoxyphenol hydroxylase-like FAD-dependent oxidoreductase
MMISPRRTILDATLVDAARSAGAEVREGCSLVELTRDGNHVTGARVQDRRTRHTVMESAALVVGADGKHSTVARLVAAADRRSSAAATFACYAYWDGLPVKGGEIYSGKDLLSAHGRRTKGSLSPMSQDRSPNLVMFGGIRRLMSSPLSTRLAASVNAPGPPFK